MDTHRYILERRAAEEIAGTIGRDVAHRLAGAICEAARDAYGEGYEHGRGVPPEGSEARIKHKADQLVLEAMHELMEPSLISTGDEWPLIIERLIECPGLSPRGVRWALLLRESRRNIFRPVL